MLAILLLAQFGPQLCLPGPYPYNQTTTPAMQTMEPPIGEFRRTVKGICLAKFVARDRVSPPILARRRDMPEPQMWIDRYVKLNDDGTPLMPEVRLSLVVASANLRGDAPKEGASYVLGYDLPDPARTGLIVLVFNDGPELWIKPERDWLVGLYCIPSKEVMRAKAPSGALVQEDVFGSFVLTLGNCFRFAKDEEHSAAIARIMVILKLYRLRFEKVAGSYFFEWSPKVLEPVIVSASRDLPDSAKIHALGLAASLPDSNSVRPFWDLVVKLDKKGGLPMIEAGGYRGIPPDEIASVALRSKNREYFFDRLDAAPSDPLIARFVEWLSTARPAFAATVLTKLANWAGREDLKPNIVGYVKGEPTIVNREVLTRIWMENPPPIKRGG